MNNKILFTILSVCLSLTFVLAVNVGSGITPDIGTEDFEPIVWMCDDRVVYDDGTEPGRVSPDGAMLIERKNNYAFEGEQIGWDVVVMDKNGAEKILDVFVSIGAGDSQTITFNQTSTNCGDVPLTQTNWGDTIALNKFNPALGTLLDAKLSIDANIVTNLQLEHTSTSSAENYTMLVNGTVDALFGDVNISAMAFFSEQANLSIYDGVPDFNGTSGVTISNLSQNASTMGSISNLSSVSGTGETFNVSANATSNQALVGMAGNNIFGVTTLASAQACVTYTYEVERFVSGDGEIEANCGEVMPQRINFTSCNARILEEEITEFDPQTMKAYECLLTVETPESMYGEYWVQAEAFDLDGLAGIFDEREFWFLNPVIALVVDGDVSFDDIRPGTDSYSSTLTVGNDADLGSGVRMDMFISGTDFYDSASSGAMCPTTNQLGLENFRYFATSGAFSSFDDAEVGRAGGVAPTGVRGCDAEGYCNIGYGIGFNDPHPFYDGYEILQAGLMAGPYWQANVLTPGAEHTLTFKLSLPEPCNGDFDTGSLYFWGEAI